MTAVNEESKKWVLDKDAPIVLDIETFPIPIEPIKHLPKGLFEIARYIRELEIKVKNGEDIDKIIDWGLLTNYFHWFANTSINYLRYIALIDIVNTNNWTLEDINKSKLNIEKVKTHCTSYVQKLIPEIYKFRNKISAHYASTDPKNDNLGMLQFAGMIPISYIKPYFNGGGFNFEINGETSNIPSWALTFEYEKICERCSYLPANFKIPLLK
jgi:hypothetical protein